MAADLASTGHLAQRFDGHSEVLLKERGGMTSECSKFIVQPAQRPEYMVQLNPRGAIS